MYKLKRILLLLPFVCAFWFSAVNAQITEISEIKDVKPTDKYYKSLESLIENYEIELTDEYDMFHPGDAVTRLDFAFTLDSGFDSIVEKYGQDLFDFKLYERFSVNNLGIKSVDEIKDVSKKDYYWGTVKILTEKYGIDICDADKNFRPKNPVTEREFYTWIAKIFDGNIGGNPSATKALTRGEFVIVMNAAFENVSANIRQREEEIAAEKKLSEIKALPILGKVQIIDVQNIYPIESDIRSPRNKCVNFSNPSRELWKASKNGGIVGDYKPKNGDAGDIVFETIDSCKKDEKVLMIRIGTAIVTISEKGIKRLK